MRIAATPTPRHLAQSNTGRAEQREALGQVSSWRASERAPVKRGSSKLQANAVFFLPGLAHWPGSQPIWESQVGHKS